MGHGLTEGTSPAAPSSDTPSPPLMNELPPPALTPSRVNPPPPPLVVFAESPPAPPEARAVTPAVPPVSSTRSSRDRQRRTKRTLDRSRIVSQFASSSKPSRSAPCASTRRSGAAPELTRGPGSSLRWTSLRRARAMAGCATPRATGAYPAAKPDARHEGQVQKRELPWTLSLCTHRIVQTIAGILGDAVRAVLKPCPTSRGTSRWCRR